MVNRKEKPHIETRGLAARLYDCLILLGTLGFYQILIKRVIQDMSINPEDSILDFGAGTGKNDLLMLKYLSDDGSITALEIGKEMRKQFLKKCGCRKNVTLENFRIETPLPYSNRFDKVFISFVIHGFEQNKREKIIKNAFNALKPGGRLLIFDWNEFDLKKSGPFIRLFMKFIECDEAQDFIQRDFKEILTSLGFKNIEENIYTLGRIRLLSGEK